MTVNRGGEAKAIPWADGAATEGNRESAPHLSPEPSGVPTPMYPEPAGRGGASLSPPDSRPSDTPPPAPLCVGGRTELHLFTCRSPEQHERAVVGGCVVASLDDGAGWLVRLDRPVPEFGGSLVEGPSWPREGTCPNATPVAREAAA